MARKTTKPEPSPEGLDSKTTKPRYAKYRCSCCKEVRVEDSTRPAIERWCLKSRAFQKMRLVS